MKQHDLRVLLALALFSGVQAAIGASDEYEAIEVPFAKTANSLSYASKAVKLTLLDRHWNLDKETDTSIQATLKRPDDSISVTVLITFDISKATISYVDSRLTGQRPVTGGAMTSKVDPFQYRGWVNNLAKDLPVNVQRIHILLN